MSSVAIQRQGCAEPLCLRKHQAAVIGLTKAIAADFVRPGHSLQCDLSRNCALSFAGAAYGSTGGRGKA